MIAQRLSQTALSGIHEARQGNTTAGCVLLEEALRETSDPTVQAWYAYCLAREGRNFNQALQLCLSAQQRRSGDSDICLALGRLYLIGKRRRAAISILERGLRIDKNPEIQKLLQSIGMRKPPVFRFLNRDNPLNVASGRLLSHWGLR